MRRILILILLFLPVLAFSQVKIDSIPKLTEVDTTTRFPTIHGPEGAKRWKYFTGKELRTFSAADIINRAYVPDTTGSHSVEDDYGNFIRSTADNNNIYYCDYNGNCRIITTGGDVTSENIFFVKVNETVTDVDQGDTLEFNLASAGITGGTTITADGADDIDLSNYFFAKINLGSTTNETLTLSTPSNYLTYNIHFSGVSQDTVVFPANFLVVGGDSIKTRVLTDDIIVSFYYDGTNFYTPSGFGLAQNLLMSMFAAMFKGMAADTIISPFMLGQFQPVKIGQAQIGVDNKLNEQGSTIRASTTFANQVFFDSLSNTTWIATQGDNSTGRETYVYGIDHNKKNQSFRFRVPSPNISNDDTHQHGSFYLTPSGQLGLLREDEHVSPIFSYTSTGTSRDTLLFAATSTDSTAYYQPFYFRDTLLVAYRNTSQKVFSDINNATMFHELATSTNGQNFSVFRRLTENYSVQNSPYLTVAYDTHDQDVAYYIGNSRLYGTIAQAVHGPIYYRIWIYKSFYPSGTLYSIDETYSADTVSFDAVFSDLTIEALTDSTSGNLEIGHFYVDESNDLHLLYWNATDGYVKFLKTNGTSYTIDTIPGISAPTNEGTIGIISGGSTLGVQDFITFAYVKPNVYDLFYYSDDTGSGYTVKKYRTIDGFSSIDGGEVISPSGALVRSMRMTTNYKPGRPCVIAMEAQYPSSNENEVFLFTYTYQPR